MNTDTLERPNSETNTPQSSPLTNGASSTPTESQTTPYQDVKSAASEQIRHITADLKESGSDTLQSAKDAGSNYIDKQKERFASQIDRYTEAVKSACETLENGDANPLISPAKRASQQMEKFSGYLRNHNAKEFLSDLGDLARRKPEIVFGGLFVVGLASVRFLKASSRQNQPTSLAGENSSYIYAPSPFQPQSGEEIGHLPSNINY